MCDYQTTANICTQLKEDSLKKAVAALATVFKKKEDAKCRSRKQWA